MEMSVITKVEFKLNKNLDLWIENLPNYVKDVDKFPLDLT